VNPICGATTNTVQTARPLARLVQALGVLLVVCATVGPASTRALLRTTQLARTRMLAFLDTAAGACVHPRTFAQLDNPALKMKIATSELLATTRPAQPQD